MTKRNNGPQQIGSLLTDDLLVRIEGIREQSQRLQIEKQAHPGESWDEAAARLSKVQQAPSPPLSVRKLPPSDTQLDFFVPTLYDIGTKDSRGIMDVAVFRLSKKDRRAGDVIHYALPDGHVIVSAGAAGMASVWDYDLVLMAVSHLTEATNRYRDGKGEKPGRVFRPHVADVLKFCRRSDGGKQKSDLVETCIRLNTTHVAVQRTRRTGNGQTVMVSEGEALISRYRVVKSDSGKPEYIEIELADWMYREITEGKSPDVLTVHPDYFLIDPGIGRFVYRLARRAAGKGQAKWSFKTIFERSGSTGTFSKFAFTLRKLIDSGALPEYVLSEEVGQVGPLLVMRHQDAMPDEPSSSFEDDSAAAGASGDS
jgi:plasmid replication initiation protein